MKTTSKLTPADLNSDMGLCLQKGDYDDAADLFALDGVYGWYDRKRVADETAHDAIGVLQMYTLGNLSDDQKRNFSDIIGKQFAKGSGGLKQLCKEISAIGIPDYYPAYMIQHGMNAVMSSLSGKTSSDDGLVKDFDSKAAWSSALDGYLHCPSE